MEIQLVGSLQSRIMILLRHVLFQGIISSWHVCDDLKICGCCLVCIFLWYKMERSSVCDMLMKEIIMLDGDMLWVNNEENNSVSTTSSFLNLVSGNV